MRLPYSNGPTRNAILTIAATPMTRRMSAVISVKDTGKTALAMDEPFRPHRLSQMAQSQHELHVVDDAENEHHDAQSDQGEAEVARRGSSW